MKIPAHGKTALQDANNRAERVEPFRAQHLDLAVREIITDAGAVSVLINDSESPLAWLARRKGRDGRGLISPNQYIAGEKTPR
jgi:hypothetical protein